MNEKEKFQENDTELDERDSDSDDGFSEDDLDSDL